MSMFIINPMLEVDSQLEPKGGDGIVSLTFDHAFDALKKSGKLNQEWQDKFKLAIKQKWPDFKVMSE